MKFVYGLHIMWYEWAMLKEHFSSFHKAIQHSGVQPEDYKLVVHCNYQTYLETPDPTFVGNPMANLMCELDYCLEKYVTTDNIEIRDITDEEPFRNIADFRRELSNPNGWVCWGETDCVLPAFYFLTLDALPDMTQDGNPFVATHAYRKMWDGTWNPVEHPEVRSVPYSAREGLVDAPWNWHDYITDDQLFNINWPRYQSPEVVEIEPLKFDGSLLAIYKLNPEETPIIPDDMHFAHEDFITQLAMSIHGFRQYHLANILKGHNYSHPQKRIGTSDDRSDEKYQKANAESRATGLAWINTLRRIDND